MAEWVLYHVSVFLCYHINYCGRPNRPGRLERRGEKTMFASEVRVCKVWAGVAVVMCVSSSGRPSTKVCETNVWLLF